MSLGGTSSYQMFYRICRHNLNLFSVKNILYGLIKDIKLNDWYVEDICCRALQKCTNLTFSIKKVPTRNFSRQRKNNSKWEIVGKQLKVKIARSDWSQISWTRWKRRICLVNNVVVFANIHYYEKKQHNKQKVRQVYGVTSNVVSHGFGVVTGYICRNIPRRFERSSILGI